VGAILFQRILCQEPQVLAECSDFSKGIEECDTGWSRDGKVPIWRKEVMAHDSLFTVLKIFEFLPDNLEGIRVLDAGSGCGTVVHKIISTSGRPWSRFKGMPIVIGVEKDPELVEFAKKWMPFYKNVFLRDLNDIPYPDEIVGKSIDIVLCSESVEHWLDKKRGLKTVEYLISLAPTVIFTCPNGDQTNKLYEQDYHNHNLVWNVEDFEQFGLKTEIFSQYPKSIELLLRIAKPILMREPLSRHIIAWKVLGG
jgi:SAM-dependent methyltransferase